MSDEAEVILTEDEAAASAFRVYLGVYGPCIVSELFPTFESLPEKDRVAWRAAVRHATTLFCQMPLTPARLRELEAAAVSTASTPPPGDAHTPGGEAAPPAGSSPAASPGPAPYSDSPLSE